jgi:hypothetical protein
VKIKLGEHHGKADHYAHHQDHKNRSPVAGIGCSQIKAAGLTRHANGQEAAE